MKNFIIELVTQWLIILIAFSLFILAAFGVGLVLTVFFSFVQWENLFVHYLTPEYLEFITPSWELVRGILGVTAVIGLLASLGSWSDD
tara:strand:+ start:41 stop:304 length:264 start_codon:yes stop_codon:yes gene_type:complete